MTTSRFDITKYLVDDETIANYLDDCLEEGGTSLFLKAVGEVARARGMTDLAASAGLTRASLYKSLDEGGNPGLGTMERVMDSLGFRLSVVPKPPKARAREKAAGSVAEPTSTYRSLRHQAQGPATKRKKK